MGNEGSGARQRVERRTGLGPPRRRPELSWLERLWVVCVVGLLFAQHLLIGGVTNVVSFGSCAIFGLALATTCLARLPGRRPERPFPVAELLFLAVLGAVAWGLTPFAFDGPHPIWGYVTAPAAGAIDRSAGLQQILQLLGLACLFLVGRALGESDQRARFLLRTLVVGSLVYAIWAFLSHVIEPGMLYGAAKRVHANRLTASFISANTAGSFFGIASALSTTWLLEVLRSSRGGAGGAMLRDGALPAVALCTCMTDLALTASRGAMAATAAALIFLVMWQALSRGWRWSSAIGFAAAAMIAGATLMLRGFGAVVERSADLGADAVDRARLFSMHWDAFRAAPWGGYGLGGFDSVHQMLMGAPGYAGLSDIHAAHNVYLQWLEEGGVLGAGLMFACIAFILGQIVMGAFRRKEMTTWLRGVTAASLVLILHGWTDYGLQIPSMQALWACLLGAGSAVAIGSSRRSRPRSEQRAGAAWLEPIGSVATAALAALIAGAAVLGGLTISGAAPATGELAWTPVAEAHALQANRAMDRAWPTKSRPELLLSRAATMRELALSPASGAGWLRLAILEAAPGGAGTDAADAALRRSYAVAPFDARLLVPRTRFAFDHWGALDQDQRTSTLRHIELAWPIDFQRARVVAALGQVGNPDGHGALRMKIFALRIGQRIAEKEAESQRKIEAARPEAQTPGYGE